jgi:hypothetical protein
MILTADLAEAFPMGEGKSDAKEVQAEFSAAFAAQSILHRSSFRLGSARK